MNSSKTMDKVKEMNLQVKARFQLSVWAKVWFLTLLFGGLALFAVVGRRGPAASAASTGGVGAQSNERIVTPIPFGEMNGSEVYNASGAVPLGDSRFLLCDNKTSDALFELDLTADGRMKNRLIRRPLQGIVPGVVNDLESMTIAEEEGRQYIFAASSLSIKSAKGGGKGKIISDGLLRVRINADGGLSAENMAGFREWLIRQTPEIVASANLIPDEGGLNVEGLAWDQSRHALLFGLRTPLSAEKPMVIPVRVKNLAGPWTTANLELLPPIQLRTLGMEGEQGVRSIEYIPSHKSFLVVLGKTISKTRTPFGVYEWNGYPLGALRRLGISFADKMKPEGLTSGTIAGKPMLLFLDDGGGYQVLWLDKPGLY
jgi:hypothetical protein